VVQVHPGPPFKSCLRSLIAAHMGGDEQEARQQAIALFSSLVGAMMLSRAVKKSDPTLSDELLTSARTILKLKK